MALLDPIPYTKIYANRLHAILRNDVYRLCYLEVRRNVVNKALGENDVQVFQARHKGWVESCIATISRCKVVLHTSAKVGVKPGLVVK